MPHCSQVTGTQTRDEEKNPESGLSLRAECKLAVLYPGFPNQWEGKSLVFLVLALRQTGKPGSQHPALGPKTTREARQRTCGKGGWHCLLAALEAWLILVGHV